MSTFLNNTKIHLLIIVVLTVLAYSNIFQNEFVSDDKGFIANWAVSQKFEQIPQVLAGEGPPYRREAVYRPVRDILYVIYGKLFGTNVFWYHLHSITVHLGVTVLVYLIAAQLVGSGWLVVGSKKGQSTNYELQAKRTTNYLPFITALLFGLHPIHTEAITFMTSSMDMIGPLFFFASFWLYLKASAIKFDPGSSHSDPGSEKRTKKPTTNYPLPTTHYILSIAFALLAFFSYELTLVLPILIVLYELCLRSQIVSLRSGIGIRLLPYFIAAALYVLVRVFLIGRYPGGANYWISPDSFDWSRLMIPEVILKYLQLLAFPKDLSFSHIIRPGFETFLAWVNDPAIFNNYSLLPNLAAALLIIASLGFVFKLRKAQPILAFGTFWFLIAFLPFSNIVSQPALMAERYTYIASFGFILGLSYLSYLRHLSYRRLTLVIFLAIAAIYGTQTYTRNLDWQTGYTLWASMARIYPQSALAYNNIGITYVQDKKFQEAIPYYSKALEIRPSYFYARHDLGTAYKKVGRFEEAEEQYKKTLEAMPSYLISYTELAGLYRDLKKYDLAETTLTRATGVKKEQTPLPASEFKKNMAYIYYELAQTYQEQNKVQEAYDTYQKVLPLSPNVVTVREKLNELIVNNPSIWPKYQSKGFSFNYPNNWQLKEEDSKINLKSGDDHYHLQLELNVLDLPPDQYLASLTDSYGSLIRQEKTQIENFSAYVKIWKDKDHHNVQFFIFVGGGKVVKILAYPSESSLENIFNAIIDSIKIE